MPTQIKVVCTTPIVGDVRIHDVTNKQVIAERLGIHPSPPNFIFDLGSIVNPSGGEAVWVIEARTATGLAFTVESVSVFYQ